MSRKATAPLEEWMESIIDYRGKTPTKTDSGVPLVTAKIIKSGRIETPSEFIAEEDYEEWMRRGIPKGGDVVITTEAPLGEVAQLPDHKIALAQRVITLRGKQGIVDNTYLKYLLLSSEFQHDLESRATGTTVFGIKQSVLRKIELSFPDFGEQKGIAHILGTLDEKIELNRKTNETLEGIAKALFKSWFVDFDPVRAKAEGRPTGLPDEISELFPDSFEESELGDIPSGWNPTCLDDITDFVIGGDWGKGEQSNEFSAPMLCIRGADIPDLQDFGYGKMPARFLKESSAQKRSLRHGDIVFEISGGSPTQSTGRPVLVESEMLEKFKSPLTCSNFCRLVRPLSIAHSRYVYQHLRQAYDSGEMFMYETGTTGIKNFGYKHYASSRFFPLSGERLLSVFSSVIGDLRQRCHLSGSENSTLASLRDALLPRLISGELRVPDAEKMLEEVGI